MSDENKILNSLNEKLKTFTEVSLTASEKFNDLFTQLEIEVKDAINLKKLNKSLLEYNLSLSNDNAALRERLSKATSEINFLKDKIETLKRILNTINNNDEQA